MSSEEISKVEDFSSIRPTPIKRTRKMNCRLSNDGTLNLEETLLSFNEPIGLEQAWAICHQSAKCLLQLGPNNLQELTQLSQILLHKDGHVLLDIPRDTQASYASEKKVVFSLGMLIFKALDFRLDQKEERRLSLDLQNLINIMTGCDEEYEPEERLHETDDEGIGRDSEAELDEPHDNGSYTPNRDYCSLKNVIQVCVRHAQTTEDQADVHYMAVIRAFVHEALELTQFLEKIAVESFQDTSNNKLYNSECKHIVASQQLDTLSYDDWTDIRIWRAIQARFWVQVIGELRRGIKLKKVEENLGKRGKTSSKGRGSEYELTPYEILMNDIKERRYKLRKTPPPSKHVTKDARATVLEFIRSRPPLKKASDRQLPPRRKQSTMRELLMESIKKPPRPLRSCRERQLNEKKPDYIQPMVTTESGDLGVKKQPRKLIPVDFDLKLDGEEDDDDDDDEDDEYAVTRFEDEDDPPSENQNQKAKWYGNKSHVDLDDDDDKSSANPWKRTGRLRLTQNEYHRFCDAQLESYDLATQCPSRRASARKHTGRCSTAPFAAFAGTSSVPHSRPHSRQHAGVLNHDTKMSLNPSPNTSPSISPRARERILMKSHTTVEPDRNDPSTGQAETERKPSLGDMFLDERLSLTLEEIVHIRSVLTKAELESLPVEGRVKEDVEKRRVCFLCLKTRFGILGPWGQRCRLCERTVCVKCYSKMRIPTEHFAHVPVVLLSPGLLLSPSNSEPDSTRSPWPRPGGAIGSAPASPAHRRRDPLLSNATPLSTPNPGTPADNLTPGSTPTSIGRRDDLLLDKSRYPKVGGSPSRMTSSAIGNLGSGIGTEQRLIAERLRGVSMVVCHDCRIMVIQIIKSSRSTRATIRNNVISRLTLNLSPAYV
ncbi:protein spire isoform X2 [Chelonus insularis]|uniref:protein spire isoform X2 n=1 Tax=Chelonus insularis TaxID=460826 RepID=UPI0015890D2B|nr:protein spire isoform X2 [Chelonus insularis]